AAQPEDENNVWRRLHRDVLRHADVHSPAGAQVQRAADGDGDGVAQEVEPAVERGAVRIDLSLELDERRGSPADADERAPHDVALQVGEDVAVSEPAYARLGERRPALRESGVARQRQGCVHGARAVELVGVAGRQLEREPCGERSGLGGQHLMTDADHTSPNPWPAYRESSLVVWSRAYAMRNRSRGSAGRAPSGRSNHWCQSSMKLSSEPPPV